MFLHKLTASIDLILTSRVAEKRRSEMKLNLACMSRSIHFLEYFQHFLSATALFKRKFDTKHIDR
jgi:hypothetical protein